MTAIHEPRHLAAREEPGRRREVRPGEPARPHRQATGMLLSAALCAVLIAVVTALAGWRHAGYPLAWPRFSLVSGDCRACAGRIDDAGVGSCRSPLP